MHRHSPLLYFVPELATAKCEDSQYAYAVERSGFTYSKVLSSTLRDSRGQVTLGIVATEGRRYCGGRSFLDHSQRSLLRGSARTSGYGFAAQ